MKQDAEIALYFGNKEVSDKILSNLNRIDLVLDNHIRTGDWFSALELLKTKNLGNDALFTKVYGEIGGYYYDRKNWKEACVYLEKSRIQNVKLISCYVNLEDYDKLYGLIKLFPPTDTNLLVIIYKFNLTKDYRSIIIIRWNDS